MSDYTQTTDFSAKDDLSSGDAEKLILGSDFDTEFDAIATAISSKYDSTDIATQAQAEAETLNTVLLTPLRLAQWSDDNGGFVGDIQALADPNADTILGWDDSAGAVINYSIGTGLTSSTTTILLDTSNTRNVDHASVTFSAGTGLTGGGTLAANRSFSLSHLGLESLTDPNDDRIAFWDDSAGAFAWLDIGTGLTLTTTTLSVNDGAIAHDSLSGFVADEHVAHSGVSVVAASNSGLAAGNDDLSSNIGLTIDLTTLTNIEGSALAATDEILVNDGGVNKAIEVQALGLRVQTAQTTQTLAAADMNSIMEFTGTATLTLPLNASVDLPIGVPVILNMKHATQELTVTAAASVTLVSVFHPAGAAAASDVVMAGGTAILYKTAADVWCLAGDITDA